MRGSVDLKPGAFATQFERDTIPQVTELSRQEKGCLAYDWYRDLNNDKVYVCTEIYENAEALHEHFGQRYTRKLLDMAAKEGHLKMKAIEAVGKSLKDTMYAPDNAANHVAVVKKFTLRIDDGFLDSAIKLTDAEMTALGVDDSKAVEGGNKEVLR